MGAWRSHRSDGGNKKMVVICLSESAEVLMQGLERITHVAAELRQRSQTLPQLRSSLSLYLLSHTFAPSDFHFCRPLPLSRVSIFCPFAAVISLHVFLFVVHLHLTVVHVYARDGEKRDFVHVKKSTNKIDFDFSFNFFLELLQPKSQWGSFPLNSFSSVNDSDTDKGSYLFLINE